MLPATVAVAFASDAIVVHAADVRGDAVGRPCILCVRGVTRHLEPHCHQMLAEGAVVAHRARAVEREQRVGEPDHHLIGAGAQHHRRDLGIRLLERGAVSAVGVGEPAFEDQRPGQAAGVHASPRETPSLAPSNVSSS
jgi:hypothetical protein